MTTESPENHDAARRDGSRLSEGLGAILPMEVWEQRLGTHQALRDVLAERERQDGKWGGPEHDDGHSTADFAQLIQDYAAWARTMAGMNSPERAERRLIQVAALAVAAVESSRRLRGA